MQNTETKSVVNRSPFYYGWIVWIIATLSLIATSPGQSFTVSLFFDFFIADFGLDRTTVSGLYGLGTFIASLSLTWVGYLVDRHGNRKVGTGVGILFALALIFMSVVVSPFMLFFGFLMIRGLGQGALGLIGSTAVANWFEKRRGQMMSFTIVGFFLFQSAYVPLVESLLEVYPWEQVWLMLAAMVTITATIPTWLFMRDKPEHFGLQPDGAPTDPNIVVVEEGWTLKEARSTTLFWVFVVGRVVSPAWGTGIVIHLVSIFENLGYSRRVAADTYGMTALLTAGAAIVAGYLVDRLKPGMVMAMQMAALICAMGLPIIMTEQWMLILWAISFSIVMGFSGVFDGSVWANLFGRAYQGTIRGFITTLLVAGTSLGPITFGLNYDSTGNYNIIFLIGIAISLVVIVLSLIIDLPTYETVKERLAEKS